MHLSVQKVNSYHIWELANASVVDLIYYTHQDHIKVQLSLNLFSFHVMAVFLVRTFMD